MSNCAAASSRLEIARAQPQAPGGSGGARPAPAFKAGSRPNSTSRGSAALARGRAGGDSAARNRRARAAMYGLAVLLGQQPGELVAELSPFCAGAAAAAGSSDRAALRSSPPPPGCAPGRTATGGRDRPHRRGEVGLVSQALPHRRRRVRKRQPQQMVRARQPVLVDRPERAVASARFRPGARGSARANRRAGGGAGDV